MPGAVLLARHEQLVQTIKLHCGVPPAVWTNVHSETLTRFAAFVQMLPASEADHHARPGGLLGHSLEVANHALQLRRGYMLPESSAPEVATEQHEAWSFAFLTAALLQDLDKPLTDVLVDLRIMDDSWVPWKIITGPMPPDAEYRIRYDPQRRNAKPHTISLLIANQIVSPPGLEWLAAYPDVLHSWLSALAGHKSESGTLGAVIAQADQYSVSKDVAGNQALQPHRPRVEVDDEMPDAPPLTDADIASLGIQTDSSMFQEVDEVSDQKHTSSDCEIPVEPASTGVKQGSSRRELGESFLEWLRSCILENQIAFNNISGHLHVVEEGLLIISPNIFRRYIKQRSAEGVGLEFKAVQKGFETLGVHQRTPEGKNITRYRVVRNKGSESNTTISGMLIPDPLRTLGLERLPEINPVLIRELKESPHPEG